MQWILGKQNLADALKKINIGMFKVLNKALKSGMLLHDIISIAKRVSFIDQTPQRDEEIETAENKLRA